MISEETIIKGYTKQLIHQEDEMLNLNEPAKGLKIYKAHTDRLKDHKTTITEDTTHTL